MLTITGIKDVEEARKFLIEFQIHTRDRVIPCQATVTYRVDQTAKPIPAEELTLEEIRCKDGALLPETVIQTVETRLLEQITERVFLEYLIKKTNTETEINA